MDLLIFQMLERVVKSIKKLKKKCCKLIQQMRNHSKERGQVRQQIFL